MEQYRDLTRVGSGKSAFEDLTGGGGDTVTKIAADFSNSTVTFNTITDGARTMSYLPPTGVDFEIEAFLLIQTATATVLPRLQIAVGAGQLHGSVSVEQVGATLTTEVVQHGTFLAAAVNVTMPVGGLPAANTPYEATVRIKGRSGLNPTAIALLMASETAGTACLVKAGSRMTVRVLA